MTDLKLDILIPHYNDADGLALSLNSVLSQTWSGAKRVVVADDGSTPEALAQVKTILAALPVEAVLIEGKTNRGRPYTRNVLLDSIDSAFTAWLDAGDEWYRDKLSLQFETVADRQTHASTQPYWVTCDYDWKWTGARARHVAQVTRQDQIRAVLVGRNLRSYLWTLLAPSENFKMVGKFDENLPRLQDVDYFLRFLVAGGNIVSPGVKRPLCVYHKSDIGRDARQIRQCNNYIFDKHHGLYDRYGNTFRRGRKYEMELLSARFAMKNHDYLLSGYYFSKAITMKPLSFAKRVVQKGFRF